MALATAAQSGFEPYAAKLGLDASKLKACLAADAALARVTADKDEATRLKADSTPTLFIGRMRKDGGVDLMKRINGAHPSETFVAEVAKLTHR